MLRTGIFFRLLCAALFVAVSVSVSAVSLNQSEIKTINSLTDFIEVKPAGKDYEFCENARRSSNPALRGMAVLVLYKHYGKPLMPMFIRCFTLDPAIGFFKQQKPSIVAISAYQNIKRKYEAALSKIDDERVRKLFLFFHFREANSYLVGNSGEKLSLAGFYRIAAFEGILGEKYDSIAVAERLDSVKIKADSAAESKKIKR